MCRMLEHKCYCGVTYPCHDENFVCPTINGDEESNMCPKCLEKWEQEYADWYYSQDTNNV